MTSKVVEMTTRVRGEEIQVRAEGMVCDRCVFRVLTDEQSDAYTIASADAYREKHGLLTSGELEGIRTRLGMSQQSFASFLRVGVASVKRWESGLVQYVAMDQLIRLKTDLATSRENVTTLAARLGTVPSEAGVQVILLQAMRRESEAEWDPRRGPFRRTGRRTTRDFWKHST